MSKQFQNLDAGEGAYFTRELEAVKSRTYDVRYPEFKARKLIPVSGDAGPGAESIVYRQYDMVGTMKIITSYADDLPRSDVKGTEFTAPVKSVGGSYGYNVQEVRAAQKAGRPLEARRAEAARRSYEQIVNEIAFKARPADGKYGGLTGLLYNANVTKGAATYGNWGNAATTADQILFDMNKAVNDVITLTKGVEIPNVLVMPLAAYTRISTTPRSTTSDTTILEFFQRTNPGVSVEWANEVSGVNPKPTAPTVSASTNLMIAYRRDPMNLTLEIPQEFEQFPPQERGLEYIVPTHGRIGGVLIYYPLSVNIVEGIIA